MADKKNNHEIKNHQSSLKTARVFKKGDDLFACSRCGTCLAICPVYKNTLDESFAPRGKLSLIEAVANKRIPFTDRLSKKIYTCTMCDFCTSECPSGVKVNELFAAVREDLVENKKYPEVLDYLKDKIEKAYNITFDSNQGRTDWLKQVPGTDIGDYVKQTAEVVYFVGCVSSFSPRSFSIPRAIVKLLKIANVDFTLLSEDEWCCGFPLLGSGMRQEVKTLAEHNIEAVIKRNAKVLLTSCPSCFHTWKHEYEKLTGIKAGFEIMHVSQYLLKLVKEGAIKPGSLNIKVTYHDPCDLGRNSGIYDEPRQLIKSIPDVELIEMASAKKQANCCGGGGNIESLDPALSAKIADNRAEEVLLTGAEIALSACQQCERTMGTALKKKKSEGGVKLKAMDVAELLLKSLESEQN